MKYWNQETFYAVINSPYTPMALALLAIVLVVMR